MALIKTIGSKIENGVEISPQIDIPMGPLEEAATLAEWACGMHKSIRPEEMPMCKKIDALVNPAQGATFVADSVSKHQEELKIWQKKYQELSDDRHQKYKAYHDEMAKKPSGTITC